MANQTTTRKIQEGFNKDLGRIPLIDKGGKPLKIKTPEILQEIVTKYFNDCDSRVVEIYDSNKHDILKVNSPEPYTMSGLAYAMGMDRSGILQYGRRNKYYNIIKRARDKVNVDLEKRLIEGKNVIGAIFSLKNNFNWIDKTEVIDTTTGKVGGFVVIKDNSNKLITNSSNTKVITDSSNTIDYIPPLATDTLHTTH